MPGAQPMKHYHLHLRAEDRQIPIAIGVNLFDELKAFIADSYHRHRVFIICDSNLERIYGGLLRDSFAALPRFGGLISFPAGEGSKSRQWKADIEEQLLDEGAGRDTLLLAFGGGVTGDLTGFVAATLHRGLPFIQVPTSLMAQVDSSIGGKVGINLRQGKNLLGAFYQPAAIFIDIDFLQTLPQEEFLSGLAEVIKYAITLDPNLLAMLRDEGEGILERRNELVEAVISRCVRAKIEIVRQDERDLAERAVLNFGHTAGHAIETLSGYRIPHGFAVAAGIRIALRLSTMLLGLPDSERQRLENLLRDFGFAASALADIDPEQCWQAMRRDKKAREGLPQFCLLRAPGRVKRAVPVERRDFTRALQANRSCLSLLPRDQAEINYLLSRCAPADMIELRLDFLREADLPGLRSAWHKPLIAAIRGQQEGGHWQGSVADRLMLYQRALDARFDYLDIDFSAWNALRPQLSPAPNSKFILSYHVRSNDPLPDLEGMASIEADVYKLVFRSAGDKELMLTDRLLRRADELGLRNVIVHAEGAGSSASRLLAARRGNAWTYCSLDGEHASALGQPTLDEFANVYRMPLKTERSLLLGLVGHPVSQSLGWRLHNELGARLGHNLLYVNCPCEDFAQFWETEHLWDGLSITLPHKQAIPAYAAKVSPEVERTGCANTLLRGPDGWEAYNTDYSALVELLTPFRERLQRSALVFGTGATARSAISVLQTLGAQNIVISGRNQSKGRELASLGSAVFQPLEDIKTEFDCVVQASSVGMAPGRNELSPAARFLADQALALDVVYNPPQTAFLSEAARRGCTTISGEEMFLRQAAAQYELFTASRPSMQDLRTVWRDIRPLDTGGSQTG